MNYTLSPDISIGPLKLKVSHLERSLDFYQQVVGFKLLFKTTHEAELTIDGVSPLLILEQIPEAIVVPPKSVTGLYHFAILLPSRKNLGVALQKLIDTGIHIGQADHLVSEALYISDPDHHGIEIYRDRPRNEWKKDAKGHYLMASDLLDWDGLLHEAKDMEWTGLPLGTTIGHVHFHVNDLMKAKEFYCDILGFDIAVDMSRQMGALFISSGGYHHHIGLNIWAGVGASAPPAQGTAMAYYTINFPTQVELDKSLEQLKQAGITINQLDQAWFVEDPFQIVLKMVVNK